VPWVYDTEAEDVLRFFTRLKCRLMPYLFAKAVEATETGLPMMRAMVLEFPQDPACTTLDRQYLLGDSLLVAPVLSADGSVEYYCPAGDWTNYINGEVITGPRWVKEKHGFLSAPLLVKPNTVLAVGEEADKPDYDFAENVTLRLYQLEDGGSASGVVPNLSGAAALTVTASRLGDKISVHVDGKGTWKLLLIGVDSVGEVVGGRIAASTEGTLILPSASNLEISLDKNR
jgi:alpha-D-xyloside xylohydrolase